MAEHQTPPNSRAYTRELNRSRLRIAATHRGIDVATNWHVDTEGAALLLFSLEYNAAPARLLDLFNSGLFTPPEIHDGDDFAWNEAMILDLAEALESMREWLPFSRLHAAKRTPQETAEERERHRGHIERVGKLLALPLGDLLMLLAKTPKLDERATLCAALAEKLQTEYGIEVFTPLPV